MDTKGLINLLTDLKYGIEELETALKRLRKTLEIVAHQENNELTKHAVYREVEAIVVSFSNALKYYKIYLDLPEEKPELTILLPLGDNKFIQIKAEKELLSEIYKNLYSIEIKKELLNLEEMNSIEKYYEKGKKIKILVLEYFIF